MLYEVNRGVPPSWTATPSTQRLTMAVYICPGLLGTVHGSAFMRWFSETSPVSLARIRWVQISGLIGLEEIPFATFGNPDVLHLHGSNHRGIPAALSPRSADGRTPCPCLRTLEVRWKCSIDLGSRCTSSIWQGRGLQKELTR